MTPAPRPLLDFWFGDDIASPAAVGRRSAIWFGRDAAFDAELGDRFGDLPALAERGLL